MNGLTSKWLRAATALGVVAILGSTGLLRADDTGGQASAVRLSDVEGKVQLSQAGQTYIDQAVINTPLFEGTQITTSDDGRAELQFDDGSVARIPPDSSILLAVVKPGETEVVVNGGLAYFEAQSGSGSFRVRFGNAVATTSGFTVLRVKLDQAPGELAVFSGSAHVEGSGNDIDVRGGESIAPNSESGGQFNISQSIEPDSWDTWNSDRDQALTTSETTAAPAAPEDNSNPAWGDLNSNGTWYNVPDQGYVWSPYEAQEASWDPYGVGYWVWTPRFGYVWVSGYRWGYMPYQCGYWNYYDGFGWGWAPGVCNTWWIGGGGGGDWYFNVRTVPRWYKLPVRPGPPRPRDPNPRIKVRPVGPEPVIMVRREPSQDRPPVLPPRQRGTPVLLGGRVAEPVLPTPRRVDYDHVKVTTNRPPMAPVHEDGPRPGYVRGTGRMSGMGSLPAGPEEPRQAPQVNTVRPNPQPTQPRVFTPPAGSTRPTPPLVRPMPVPSQPRSAPTPMPSRPAPAPAPSRPAPAPAPAPSHAPAAPSGARAK